jgi:hypothetical protein
MKQVARWQSFKVSKFQVAKWQGFQSFKWQIFKDSKTKLRSRLTTLPFFHLETLKL